MTKEGKIILVLVVTAFVGWFVWHTLYRYENDYSSGLPVKHRTARPTNEVQLSTPQGQIKREIPKLFNASEKAAVNFSEALKPAQPLSTTGSDNQEEVSAVKKLKIDINGDQIKEDVIVSRGPGVSDQSLKIEVLKDGKKISTIRGEFGIQSNYKIEDIDNDGKKEIIVWSGVWDPRMPGEEGVTEQTYEGHSAPHRYIVATYKLIRGEYYLWHVYTTKRKYDPMFTWDQKGLPPE